MTNPVAPKEGHYALLRNGSVVHPDCIVQDFDLDGTPYYLSPNSDDNYYWTANGVCQKQAYPKGIPKLIFVPDYDIIATISPEAMKLAANPELIGDLIKDAFDTSPEYKSLKGAVEKMLAENERLRAALNDIFEMWAGSEGFIPHTAPEGYLLMLVKKMADRAALAKGESK